MRETEAGKEKKRKERNLKVLEIRIQDTKTRDDGKGRPRKLSEKVFLNRQTIMYTLFCIQIENEYMIVSVALKSVFFCLSFVLEDSYHENDCDGGRKDRKYK
jgi:hypothetical protein